MKKILPVDKYMKRGFRNLRDGCREESVATAISIEEHALYYGYTESEDLNLVDRMEAYKLNKCHPEKLIILSACEHKQPKEKHHPDYDKPYEVELLCKECHMSRHRDVIDEVFNVPFTVNGKYFRDIYKKRLTLIKESSKEES